MFRTIFHVQFPVTGDDVLRLFSGIGVPAEPFTGLNFVHDRGRCRGAVSAIDRKSAGLMNGLVIFRPDFGVLEFSGCNNWIHAPTLDFDCMRVNECPSLYVCSASVRSHCQF